MLYKEAQVGGNCRIHALNAFFQGPRISESAFLEYIQEFNAYTLKTYNTEVDSLEFDVINSDQNNIVCYVVKKEMPQYSTKYYALNYHFHDREEVRCSIQMSNFTFVYDSNHIWGIIKKNEWFVLDSMAPISHCNIEELLSRQNIGFIVALPSAAVFESEFCKLFSEIAISDDSAASRARICDYILEKHNNSEILGNIETSINVCVEILKTALDRIPARHATIAHKIVRKYYTFLPIFTKGNYMNIEIKLKYLPYIIYGLHFIRESAKEAISISSF